MSIAVCLFADLFAPHYWDAVADDLRPTGANHYQIITGDSAEEDRRRWDQIYSSRNYVYGKEPALFLEEHIETIPPGRALDIAMGEGRNAVFLAKKGFKVDGVDISEVALKKAQKLSRDHRVSISTINADLSTYSIKPETYDLIVNINYLQRSLVPQIKRGLKKGGYVVFENNVGKALEGNSLLNPGELKELFKDFQVLIYQEGNDGKNIKASLIARKK